MSNRQAESRAYYLKNRERILARQERRRKESPSHMREIANRSYHKTKILEVRRARSQEWRDSNPEKALEVSLRYRQANREKCRERCRDWQRRNPEKVRELVMRYEARKRSATVGEVSYQGILERDGLWCYLCELEVESNDIHFDHVIPLSRGGAHSMDNIKVTHSTCNLRKGNRLVPVNSEATGEHIG